MNEIAWNQKRSKYMHYDGGWICLTLYTQRQRGMKVRNCQFPPNTRAKFRNFFCLAQQRLLC